MDWSVWGPPLVVLGLAAVGGGAFAITGTRRWAHDPIRADLQARHEVVMTRLRDLDADRDKIDDHDYHHTRRDLIQEAADILRQLDEGPNETAGAEQAATPAPKASRGAGWYLAGLVVFFTVAGLVLQNALAPRTDGSMTGNAQSGSSADPIGEAQAALEANPEDLEALNTLTKWALYTQDLDQAMQLMDRSRAIDENDPGVIVHLAALRALIGRHDESLVTLATQEDALPAEVGIWRGIIAMQQGDDATAATELRAAVMASSDPLDREFAAFLLSDLMRATQASATTEGEGDPSAAVMTTTVSSASAVEPGGVLYVYVRASPVPAGPPMLAKRIETWELPLEVSLSNADLLPFAGGVFPSPAYVQAKIARSGDPRQPMDGDMKSVVIGPIEDFSAPVELVLE
ncbi:MAG: hypothetical protein GY913_11245 [Proteobacteria bacterium]|nr:hypothetical protein [Pseudomonadota bacterium]MCP4917489.1 hypothetical protein [Pseudomonadota bacterium]